MARKKAKALPPKMITVHAEILQETEDGLLVRCDEEADGVWLPKSQVKYDGERGDTGVEIEIPDWLADEKGFFDGMGKPDPVATPAPAEPAQPETVTFSGYHNKEDRDEDGIVFNVEYEDASIDYTIPHDQIIELQFSELEEDAATITVSRAYAIETGMMPAPEDADAAEETPAGKRSFGDNVKWIKEESITVSTPLSEAEKARYAEEMAALDKEIEELEDERSDVSSRLKKQIDAKEQERREMSAHVNDGELRTFTCDCLKDYGTGEMVWTSAYPPYDEVRRRKMTKEEMQPSLLEYSEKTEAAAPSEGMDFDSLATDATPADMDDGENEAPNADADPAEDSADEPTDPEDNADDGNEPEPQEAA